MTEVAKLELAMKLRRELDTLEIEVLRREHKLELVRAERQRLVEQKCFVNHQIENALLRVSESITEPFNCV